MGYLELFLQKCLLSSPLRFICLLSKLLNLFECKATKRVNFRKKMFNIFFSKTIRWIKLILSMYVYDIILYINCVFVQIRTGCSGNFFYFLCLHLANIQVSVYWTISPLVFITSIPFFVCKSPYLYLSHSMFVSVQNCDILEFVNRFFKVSNEISRQKHQ